MQRPILISLSPNAEADDVELAWKVLFSPSSWKNQDYITNCEITLSRTMNNQPVVMTSSGRSALYTLLQAFGIGAGDEVIMQAFTCIAVPEPVLWSGAMPIYADIIPGTYNLDPQDVLRKLSPKTKAVIVQHTFGIPGPLRELQEICKQHNILLIEDLAHSFGSLYDNKPVGTFGDAAFFSFGRDKMLSSVFGGAITTSQPHIHATIQKIQADLPYPSAWWVIQQVLHPLMMHSIIPLYFRGSVGKIALVVLQKARMLSKAVTGDERRGLKPPFIDWKYSPALAQILINQLNKKEQYTLRRRDIAKKYQRELSSYTEMVPAGSSLSDPAYLRFPLQVPTPDALRKKAAKQEMILGDWYNAPLVPSNADLVTFHYTLGMCPNAENAANHVVNLPTYPLMTDADVQKVISFVQQSL